MRAASGAASSTAALRSKAWTSAKGSWRRTSVSLPAPQPHSRRVLPARLYSAKWVRSRMRLWRWLSLLAASERVSFHFFHCQPKVAAYPPPRGTKRGMVSMISASVVLVAGLTRVLSRRSRGMPVVGSVKGMVGRAGGETGMGRGGGGVGVQGVSVGMGRGFGPGWRCGEAGGGGWGRGGGGGAGGRFGWGGGGGGGGHAGVIGRNGLRLWPRL